MGSNPIISVKKVRVLAGFFIFTPHFVLHFVLHAALYVVLHAALYVVLHTALHVMLHAALHFVLHAMLHAAPRGRTGLPDGKILLAPRNIIIYNNLYIQVFSEREKYGFEPNFQQEYERRKLRTRRFLFWRTGRLMSPYAYRDMSIWAYFVFRRRRTLPCVKRDASLAEGTASQGSKYRLATTS